jgi:hypothetical protein
MQRFSYLRRRRGAGVLRVPDLSDPARELTPHSAVGLPGDGRSGRIAGHGSVTEFCVLGCLPTEHEAETTIHPVLASAMTAS